MSIALRIRPALYVAVLIVALLVSYAVKLRLQGIFACGSEGYTEHRYLGYCGGAAYGDYDHGAVWFGLEPQISEKVAAADVLFLGNSRVQFGFSTPAVEGWASAGHIQHYLLGFSHDENTLFVTPLLEMLRPRARVYVINVDHFFVDAETGPAAQVLHEPGIRQRFLQKRAWQPVHRRVCDLVPRLCGSEFALYRRVDDGHWVGLGGYRNIKPTSLDGAPANQDKWAAFAIVARKFIDGLHVDRHCVVLTQIPYPHRNVEEARAIATALDMPLLQPTVDDLITFDGSHLNPASAERWSKALLELAAPRINQCLDVR
jgi:hypothetical protein